MDDLEALTAGILKGKVRSIAKSISLVENDMPEKEDLIGSIFSHTGSAEVIGVTGPPGSGKSTLVDRLIAKDRKDGKKVAVIAVDPSSPFTKGALLADRIRMQDHASDPAVYIRSMASRGHLGGVSGATFDAVRILDAAGFDTVYVETVGVGQSEIEIVDVCDLVLLVLIPGMGDEIQALKAGIMEVGDLYVVNKKDLEGADRVKTEAEYALNLLGGGMTDIHPVVMVSAAEGDGTDDLALRIDEYFKEMKRLGHLEERRKENYQKELEKLITDKVKKVLDADYAISECLDCWAEEVYSREKDPYTIIHENVVKKLTVGEAT
jgi:LAO/AO transport system kinase